MKDDAKEQEKEVVRLNRSEDRIQFRLKRIEDEVITISATLAKDTGWRGFLLDFIKAAAQIAALVGAGKFIF